MPDESPATPSGVSVSLPRWARGLATLYEGDAASQFILHGNVNDRVLLPTSTGAALSHLPGFLLHALMPRFDVIFSYDVGRGVGVEKGGEVLGDWPAFKQHPELPREPRAAIEFLSHYFRYAANLNKLGKRRLQVGCYLRAAELIMPATAGPTGTDVSAMAMLVRDWAADGLTDGNALATFLIVENLNDLHPLVVNNPRAECVKVPLPSAEELTPALRVFRETCPTALSGYDGRLYEPADRLAGATLASVERLLRLREQRGEPLTDADLTEAKKQLVERECDGLIQFVSPTRTLDAVHGQDKIKAWLRQDIELWRRGDVRALPMGYLVCGPVGTGKTFLVEYLAGEAGVPVVKLGNFRDRWVGSTESNLEKIFRLLDALGRCIVFIDEADQTLGRRSAQSNDAGISGRVYGMFAQEMSRPEHRGRIVWVLASSRPDLIEVDLKRPGRIDVKIPVFPAASAEEAFALVRVLCERRGLDVKRSDYAVVGLLLPKLLTPGDAEAIAVKAYRLVRTTGVTAVDALRDILTDYQSPVPADVIQHQIELSVREASDLDFVPDCFRPGR